MSHLFLNAARSLAIVGVAGLLTFSSGCNKNRGVSEAQSPPPPSLSAPVRVEEQPAPPQPATVTVVPAEEYAFLKDRQAPASAPASSVPVESSAANGARPEYYTMQKGDTLYAVARKYNIPPKQLIAANNFPNPDRLPVGTRVKLP